MPESSLSYPSLLLKCNTTVGFQSVHSYVGYSTRKGPSSWYQRTKGHWMLVKSKQKPWFFFFFNLFYLFLAVLGLHCCEPTGLSLVVVSGATLCCGARGSHCGGFSCCGARALGVQASVVVVQGPKPWFLISHAFRERSWSKGGSGEN